ncbi:MAG: DUF933 domain-containing protein [Candidatus Omnitrophica bacterium]|nr:DUF933 domain-containing protein [Candidatus Omnitrophota bacterium]
MPTPCISLITTWCRTGLVRRLLHRHSRKNRQRELLPGARNASIVKIYTKNQELIGKKAFRDPRLTRRAERFRSPKVSFYGFAFTDQRREVCEAVVIDPQETLDLIVEDLDKAEALKAKGVSPDRIEKVLGALNREQLLCEQFSPDELKPIKEYAFVSAKPVVRYTGQETDELLAQIIRKTDSLFFFTAGEKEAKAWLLRSGADAVTAAGKIHSDLARGFIKAEVYNVADLDKFKNMADARQRGLLKLVGREYVVQDGDVLDVKFKA